MKNRRRQPKTITDGADSPLSAAVAGRDRSIMEIVEEAIRHRQTMLAFQPVMQARAPHGVAFYEGLIRVHDDAGRIVPAREFMHLVENAELGRELDCAALEIGLRTLEGYPQVRLSVNMSARSIGYNKWMQTLEKALKNNRRIGERLILEISEESAMMVPEVMADFLRKLQRHNVCIALDDFGAGTSALRHFRDFYLDAVKIDGQFVRGIRDNPDNQMLVAALVSVARQFDLFTVAESVESPEDAEFLVNCGVDCLQGYLFGAPTVRPPWLPQKAERASA